jgi:hypothetical protein
LFAAALAIVGCTDEVPRIRATRCEDLSAGTPCPTWLDRCEVESDDPRACGGFLSFVCAGGVVVSDDARCVDGG